MQKSDSEFAASSASTGLNASTTSASRQQGATSWSCPFCRIHRPASRSGHEGLRERFDGRKVAVCLELTRGPSSPRFSSMTSSSCFPVNPANPCQVPQGLLPQWGAVLHFYNSLRKIQPDPPAVRLRA